MRIVTSPVSGSVLAATSAESRARSPPEAGRAAPEGVDRTNVVRGQLQEVSFRGRLQLVTIAFALPEESISIKLALESSLPLPLERETFTFRLEPSQLIVLSETGFNFQKR